MAPPDETGRGQGCRGQGRAGPQDTGVAGVVEIAAAQSAYPNIPTSSRADSDYRSLLNSLF